MSLAHVWFCYTLIIYNNISLIIYLIHFLSIDLKNLNIENIPVTNLKRFGSQTSVLSLFKKDTMIIDEVNFSFLKK